MKRDYWLDKWASGNIGFHEADVNPALADHIDRLGLSPGMRVFLPLCGKTRDIAWLLARGYRVCGAELSETAIRQLFEELDTEPVATPRGALTHYGATGLDIFGGDIFDLDGETLGQVDAVYDRAALVALPEGMRGRYAAHLAAITGGAPQLLVCYVYDQTAMDGPPFSVDEGQVRAFYGPRYTMIPLSRGRMPDLLKGRTAFDRDVWLLKEETTP